MPPLRDTRADRREEFYEYYKRNFENKTTAEIVDFMGGILSADACEDKMLYLDEMNYIMDVYENFLYPVYEDKEKELHLDMEKLERRMGEFADYALQLRIEAAREYKKQLKLIPEDQNRREEKAVFLTKASEVAIKYSIAVGTAIATVGATRSKYFHYKYDVPFYKALKAREEKYLETLTEDEKYFYEKGIDAINVSAESLKNVEPEDVGLSKKEYEAAVERSNRGILERADLNWLQDKTMGDKPKYMSEQLSSDKNRRYGRYYMGLEEEKDRQGFILDGILEKGRLKVFQEKKENKGYDLVDAELLSNSEKELFRKVCNVHFSPVLEDGSPDKELFIKRVDAIRDEIAELRKEHARFIENKDNFKDILDDTSDIEKRRRAASYISPFYKKWMAYENELFEILGRNKVNKELKRHYVLVKTGVQLGKEADKERVNEALWDAFTQDTIDKAKEVLSEANLNENVIYGEDKQLSDKESEAAHKMSNSVTAEILKDHHNKPWLQTGRDISMDSLRRMNNLYEQFKNEDRLIYINSKEYNELEKKLKAAADMYKKVSAEKREISSDERARMEAAFDAISDAALKYIEGKEEKARETDHGQNRYEIAFSALGVAYKGTANAKIEMHNIKHLLNESKTLSIDELMDRSDRTVKEQKRYEKTHKPRAKEKQKKANINM